MNCDAARNLLTAYRLGDLEETARKDVEAHLETCEDCRAALRDIEPTLDLLRDALSVPAPESEARLSAQHRARIREAMRQPQQARWLRWLTAPNVQLSAVAAVLMIGFFVVGMVRPWFSCGVLAYRCPPGMGMPEVDGKRVQAKVYRKRPASDIPDSMRVSELNGERQDETVSLSVRPIGQGTPVVRRYNMGQGRVREGGWPEEMPAKSPGEVRSGVMPEPVNTLVSLEENAVLAKEKGQVAEKPSSARETPTAVSGPVGSASIEQMLPAAPARPLIAPGLNGFVTIEKRDAKDDEQVRDELTKLLDGKGGKKSGGAAQPAQPAKPAEDAELDKSVVNQVIAAYLPASPAPDKQLEKPRFRAVGVNPFIQAAPQPFSTFSIDVDTASYTLSRNYMLRGVLPPPEAVRTEEFVNFFDYGYLPPVQETFKVYAECAPSRFGAGFHMLKIGVKGRRVGREEDHGAVLTFLVDTSGSMDKPDRIGMIRKSLGMLVEKLGPKDRVAIVQFDSQARLVLDHTPAAERKSILAAIEALQCSGSTDMEAGMSRAYEVAARHFQPRSENRVLILSDGVANLGSTTAEDILAKVETYRRQGIFCSVFGFGAGTYDDVTLETIANKGNGTYGFIDSEAEAKRLFVDDLAATLHTIAADVKIQVEFNPKRVRQYRQLGYENRQLKKEDFRNDAVDAGEVGSGQSVTALYELALTGSEREVIGTVYVRYRRTDTGKVEEIERRITQADVAASFERADARFRLAACVAEFAEILRGSPHADGPSFERLSETLQPVGLEFSLDPRVQELLRVVGAAGSFVRQP